MQFLIEAVGIVTKLGSRRGENNRALIRMNQRKVHKTKAGVAATLFFNNNYV
jgi:hypothetical protein